MSTELTIKALEILDEVIDLYLETKNPDIVAAFEPNLMFDDIPFNYDELTEIKNEYEPGAKELMYASGAIGELALVAPEINVNEIEQIKEAYGHLTDDQLLDLYTIFAKIVVSIENKIDDLF